MKIEAKKKIEGIIKDMLMTTGERAHCCFIKYFNKFDVKRQDIELIIESIGMQECLFGFYEYNNNEIQEAYAPMMGWIKEVYFRFYQDEMDVDTFLEKTNVYPIHRSIFRSYIKKGTFERNEKTITTEIEYERERLIESILGVLEYVTNDRQVIVVLNKLHLAQESAISFVRELIKKKDSQSYIIICIYNEVYEVESYMKENWNGLLKLAKYSHWQVECDDDQPFKKHDNQENTDSMNFIVNGDDIFEYLNKIHDMVSALAINQAEYYLERIYHAIEVDKISVDEKNRVWTLMLYAMTLLLNGETKKAYVMCKKLQESEYIYIDDEIKIDYYYILALVKMYSGQRDSALQTIKSGRTIAEAANKKNKKLMFEMLQIDILLFSTQEMFVTESTREISKSIVQMAEEGNQQNHLAYAYLLEYLDSVVQQNGKDSREELFQKCMELAGKLDNRNLMAMAWQRKGVLATQYGKLDEIIYCYKMCLDVRGDSLKPDDETEVFNGIGYRCIVNEQYALANQYFEKALGKAISLKSTEYVGETLYNMAINCISMGDYDGTIRLTDIILKIMSVMKQVRMKICNKSKLYGMMVVSYVKLNMMYDAKMYFDKMQTMLSHILEESDPVIDMWEDDMFLYYLSKGMICTNEKKLKEAEDAYSKARYIWNLSNGKQSYIFSTYISEEAEYFRLCGKTEKSMEVLNNGIIFCEKLKLSKGIETIRKKIECCKKDIPCNLVENVNSKIKSIVNDEMTDEIIRFTMEWGLRREIKEKRRLLSFHESWIEYLNQGVDDLEEMMNSSFSMIQNTFYLDKMIYIDYKNEDIKIRYNDQSGDIGKVQAEYIKDFFGKHRSRVIISRFEKEYSYYEDFVSLFPKNSIASMIAIPFYKMEKLEAVFIAIHGNHYNFTEFLYTFTEEDGEMYRTTLRELMVAEDREFMKQQLEKNSKTDLLTVLYNRQGMKVEIERYFHGFENSKVSRQFTAMYMDLDNFKYYNDHFGHDIGDVVLIEFSKLLKAVVDDKGCIVRYGGDEFLIIMPDIDVEEGIVAAREILGSLKYNMGFKEEVENVLQQTINVEKEHWITCSIGIASGKINTAREVNELLKKADEALYMVKNTTKCNYKVLEKKDGKWIG